MELVTKWEVWDDDAKSWQHNHIEHGHADADTPTVSFPSQKGWAKRTWRKSFGHLDDGLALRITTPPHPTA